MKILIYKTLNKTYKIRYKRLMLNIKIQKIIIKIKSRILMNWKKYIIKEKLEIYR